MKKFFIAAALIGTLAFSITGCTSNSAPPPAAKATETAAAAAADAPLTQLRDGSTTSIAALYADKPLFLNFWASWCPPCVGEMPHIDAMYKKYGDRVNFAAVSLDSSLEDVHKYLNNDGKALQLPIYYSKEKTLTQTYRIEAIPVSIIIAPGGKIINQHVGGMTAEDLEKFISSAL